MFIAIEDQPLEELRIFFWLLTIFTIDKPGSASLHAHKRPLCSCSHIHWLCVRTILVSQTDQKLQVVSLGKRGRAASPREKGAAQTGH